MTNNKADTIENYILKRLSEQAEGKIELKRTELAVRAKCAPSQVSYVLSTRFTQERGYRVESQRGLGGYIRITVVPDPDAEKNLLYGKIINGIDTATPFDSIREILDYLVQKSLITSRESILISQTALNLYRNENIPPTERVKLIRAIFKTLAAIS